MQLAQRMQSVAPSGTLSLADRARKLRRDGIDVLSFANRPPTPEPVRAAAIAAAGEAWSSGYTDTAGLPQLRQAVAEALKQECGIMADPEREVLVTVGGKEGLFCALFATLDPGAEVLIPDPSWVSYEPCVGFAGGVPVHVPTERKRGFALDPERLRAAVTPKSRMIILNTPHNPTGVVLSRDTLEAIGRIAIENDLLVIADECYRHYLYDEGARHVSIASLPGMAERTITVQTTSKIFNMFGWRVGWVTAPAAIIEPMLSIHQHIVACATTLAQAGGLAAVGLPASAAQEVVDSYREARSIMVEGLNAIPGIHVHRPQGAYFLFPDITGTGMNSAEASTFLLEQAHVLTVPGSAFGPTGEGHVRLNHSCSPAEAELALERIRSAVAGL